MIDPQELHLEAADGAPLELTLRTLRPVDYARCEALQRHIWGESFSELVPSSMMMINQKLGGVLAGIFDRDGRLAAFVFGQTGVRSGRLFHWSHMLGVHREFRGLGLGRYLKLFQRRFLLELGVDDVEWTYEPLESRNAHLNLNRLGAEPVEYLRDVYGDGSTSALHSGIGTDRFVVRWRLRDPRVEARIAEAPEAESEGRDAPIANVDDSGTPLEPPFEVPELETLRLEIPADVQAVKNRSMDEARGWREATRYAFERCFERRYRIVRLDYEASSQRSFYVLFAP